MDISVIALPKLTTSREVALLLAEKAAGNQSTGLATAGRQLQRAVAWAGSARRYVQRNKFACRRGC